MAGRKPIFATLVTSFYYGTRDLLFKVTLEPASHQSRRAKEAKQREKEEQKNN